MIRLALRNTTMVHLLVIFVAIAGILSWFKLPQEMFPDFNLDRVSISVLYPGASPEDVEQLVTTPIEEAISGLDGIDEVSSTSIEGMSTISISLIEGTDLNQMVRDVQQTVSAVPDLPEDADDPVVGEQKSRIPVITLALHGDATLAELRPYAERAKSELLSIAGVATVGVTGQLSPEVRVTIPPERLRVEGLTLPQIAALIRSETMQRPGGTIKSSKGEILLRGVGLDGMSTELGRIILKRSSGGGILTLGDIATIAFSYEEPRTIGHFMGSPSINLTVTKTKSGSTIDIADRVKQYAAQLNRQLPIGVSAGTFNDTSRYIKTRLNTVKSSGLLGLILVTLSLYFFLTFRVALVAAIGLPLAFLFAVVGMALLGLSINMISLFGFLIVLGMLVDDAIVVTENIYRHIEHGMPAKDAAWFGSKEVLWPVVAATTTTMAAFMPLLLMGGMMGKFLGVIPIVVTMALLGSLWESFFALPVHAADWLKIAPHHTQKTTEHRWVNAIRNRYLALLKKAVARPGIATLLAICATVVLVVLGTTRLPFHSFGSIDVGQFFINAEAPVSYSLDETEKLSRDLERVLLEMPKTEIREVVTNVGMTFIDFNRVEFGSNRIQIAVDLQDPQPKNWVERYINPLMNFKLGAEGSLTRSSDEVIDEVRAKLAHIPGLATFNILKMGGGPQGAAIDVAVGGDDPEQSQEAAGKLMAWLKSVPGTKDIHSDRSPGKEQAVFTLNREGRRLGLTQESLIAQVAGGFFGIEATSLQRGGDEIPIVVRYPTAQRDKVQTMDTLLILLPNGRWVPLASVADIKMERGWTSIHHLDERRTIEILGDVDTKQSSAVAIAGQMQGYLKTLKTDYPNLTFTIKGEKQESEQAIFDLMIAFALAMLIVYFILGALFHSFLDPFVVMAAIPFGISGVMLGHFIMGHDLTLLSMIGLVALSGIVVNDSLILVEFIKARQREGMSREEAIMAAGQVRLRPILLTTITTMLGLMPLLFFVTGQAAFLKPLGISLAFGLLMATLLTLIVIPSIYLMVDRWRERHFGKWWEVPEWEEPGPERGIDPDVPVETAAVATTKPAQE